MLQSVEIGPHVYSCAHTQYKYAITWLVNVYFTITMHCSQLIHKSILFAFLYCILLHIELKSVLFPCWHLLIHPQYSIGLQTPVCVVKRSSSSQHPNCFLGNTCPDLLISTFSWTLGQFYSGVLKLSFIFILWKPFIALLHSMPIPRLPIFCFSLLLYFDECTYSSNFLRVYRRKPF